MPKISWNDIHDSDSSLSSDHDEPEPIGKRVKQVSTKSDNNLKSACDKLSLSKLEVHEKKDVWLFVPNSFYDNADKVHSILEQSKIIRKLSKVKTIGWNMIVDYDDAKDLIYDGMEKEGVLIKFIYSNRNDEKCKNEQRGKVQKKTTYVQKVNTPNISRTQSTKQEVLKNDEQLISVKSFKEQRPKVKWMAKNKEITVTIDKTTSFAEGDRFNSPLNSPRSPKSFSNLKEIKSPKRYVPKNKVQNRQSLKQQKNVEVKEKELIQSDLPKIQEKKKENTWEEQIEKVEKLEEQQKKQIPIQSDNDSQSEPELKKKKNKKKKKTKNSHKTDERDPNNPFSFFS